MVRDLMRSLGGGDPWLLMEQSPSAVNWRARNAPKAPGQMRAWSYQSIARGADGILFFQWRQSAAGSEKFHSGMVPHGGTDTRVWREIEQLGTELRALSAGTGDDAVAGTRVASSVAIALDWDSWWAIEQPASPASVSYLDVLFTWHRAFTSLGLVVDFVPADGDLSSYGVVVAPGPFVATDAQLENLVAFAESGGVLLVGFGTAITDEDLHVRLGGYLGEPLRRALGVWIEEFAPPAAPDLRAIGGGAPPPVALEGAVLGGEALGGEWAEYVRVEDATTLATFTEGALAGWPAVTRREPAPVRHGTSPPSPSPKRSRGSPRARSRMRASRSRRRRRSAPRSRWCAAVDWCSPSTTAPTTPRCSCAAPTCSPAPRWRARCWRRREWWWCGPRSEGQAVGRDTGKRSVRATTRSRSPARARRRGSAR